MSDLNELDCNELGNITTALSSDEITRYAKQLSTDWALGDDGKTISHRFGFKNYYQTIAFVNVIAQIAHQQDHHPDLQVGYNQCTVTYSTHSAGGLSLKDFICAAKINHAQQL